MLLIQAFLSIGFVVLMGLLVLLSLRDDSRRLQVRLLACFAASVAALTLASLPKELTLPAPLYLLCRCIGVPNVGLAWWLGRSLFDDRFRIDAREWLGMGLLSVFQVWYLLQDAGAPVPDIPSRFAEIGLIPPVFVILHLLWTALGGLRDDLLEPRRRMRVQMVAVIVLASAVSLLAEQVPSPELERTIRGTVFLASACLIVSWLLRFNAETLRFEAPQIQEPQVQAQARPSVDPRDLPALQRLTEAMEVERAYLDPGLDLESLAARVRIPPHQLRMLINRGLGYRNFSVFVGRARVEAAKVALADPGKARVQILSIAMDAGFASLATFNRAFRALEGTTPTEFRRQALGGAPQN
jgi:AraC-like DNA-binding protein